MTSADIIRRGDYVVLEGGKVNQLFKVHTNARKKIGALGYVNLECLAGHAFHTFVKYAKAEGKFCLATEEDRLARVDPQSAKPAEDQKDNRNLEDTSSAQTTDTSTIAALKQDAKLDEILPQLIAGSQTFASKSDFAQRKYIQKKSAQYEHCFYLRRPTLRDACHPRQVHGDIFLHHHTLQYIIDKAGVFPASHTLLFDESQGLLPAAILQIHEKARTGTPEEGSSIGALTHITTKQHRMKQRFAEMLGVDSVKSASYLPVAADPDVSIETFRAQFEKKRCSSLVIACHSAADSWFECLYPLLETGGSFAVYSASLSALEAIQRKRNAWFGGRNQASEENQAVAYAMVQTEIVELNPRSYQIIPNCTHPIVQQEPHAGYVFSGVKVVP